MNVEATFEGLTADFFLLFDLFFFLASTYLHLFQIPQICIDFRNCKNKLVESPESITDHLKM